MNKNLKKIINHSNFEAHDENYVYAKVSSIPKTDHFMVTCDKDEITVVTTEDRIKELDLLERNKDNWKLIALNVSIPFYSVGFLATVSAAIAKKKMNVLIVSTYSKDYIMVKAENVELARKALLSLGFSEKQPR